MSTSPEAKQAAEEWLAPVEITSFREAFAYGYDAATAKLREELEQEKQRNFDAEKELRDRARVRIEELKQLAHQQPSEQCPKCDQLPVACKCEKPSATMPEICGAYKEYGVNGGLGCSKPKGHEGNHGTT